MVSQRKNPRRVLHPNLTTGQGHEADREVEADEAEVLLVIPITLIVPIILTVMALIW